MGQKGCPIGFRTGVTKKWRSLWYGNKQEFGKFLIEDVKIREFLRKKPSCQGAAGFVVRRMSGKIEVTIQTARPGLVIGKKGAEVDLLKEELRKLTGKEVWVEIAEIKRPELNAKLVADNIAKQIERRVSFRRAMKKAMQSVMDAGAVGVKIQVSGRLAGAEIARSEWYKNGRVPLHTLRADIDYATASAATTYGIIGVKVWINLGEKVSTASSNVGAAAPVVQ
ncbi:MULTISPECIES: 30S ribosomal protein S3 [Chlamydia]|uniref:Small ribosomal subunit protein uS3 n=2 Tax=Chlamydia TaxID=810 RepID=A0ABP2X7C8_CHLPS|nr:MULTISPECIES: 30S ribosomal protein S3 [Chlamydia]AFS19095.1 ribosomal protein S3 [Chlamydia psittaci 84/55]AFS22292.1 ribosomal protein S3 [Chlamydia psittaci VS225]AGE74675.1 30S ribosomal protein S3 [Chlamydia psittaci Mat116]EPJ15926.1 ribosomal protein S3 [Chlamydia psittaci 02DC18]EPJ17254.1 ribosomal protein S3 [Chlamydia psittaci 02DC22]EPJ19784.1 ribosomal protein S3 [Chlamydia psittaci 02DC23]EPJ20885.1 ribosomal protein S3 [Chlamydia psittaci 02DC21]EPJ24347.1 ribosomal protei